MAAELEDEQSSTSRSDESDGDDSTSLSLCDLPLADHDESDGPNSSDDCQLSPPPTDPFEFFSGNHSAAEEMCSAEDVFLKGNLLPYKAPPQLSPTKRSDAPAPKNAPFDHRRSESLDGINRPRGGGGRAAEYPSLRRAASETDPRTPQPAPPPPPPPATPRSRPKWYLVVFGSVRVPAAMEMKDIRNRQRQRRTTLLAECGGWRREEGRGPWKLLRSLSCKGVESTVVASPLSYVSHLRG